MISLKLKKEIGRPLHLRRLFDRWSFGAVLCMMVLKTLQFFRKLGIRARENGWRKVTGIFLRHDYSKFSLGTFRLTYAGTDSPPSSAAAAREIFLTRLSQYLRNRPELQWSVRPGWLSVSRRRIYFSDLVVADQCANGELRSLELHLDDRYPEFPLNEEKRRAVLEKLVIAANQMRYVPARKRPRLIAARIRRWARSCPEFTRSERRNAFRLIERILNAGFIFFEVLTPEDGNSARIRMRFPDSKLHRHPGWGLLCLSVRFLADFSEADLWCQFHHVIADGAPMQEMLRDLKTQWGVAGEIRYPALYAPVTRPYTMYCGDGIFRACCYVDFSALTAVRKALAEHFQIKVSVATLLMWGLAQHEFFRGKKMLLPVDAGESDGERELELLIIRPGIFINPERPLGGFWDFHNEMQRRLEGARAGVSESHEFFELCSMMHPAFYLLAHRLLPTSLNEIVGTVGISIIKDAEMFVSPMTDFQINGFMAVGAMQMPTENNRRAGAVCICGSRSQIRCYLEAIRDLVCGLPEMLGLDKAEMDVLPSEPPK